MTLLMILVAVTSGQATVRPCGTNMSCMQVQTVPTAGSVTTSDIRDAGHITLLLSDIDLKTPARPATDDTISQLLDGGILVKGLHTDGAPRVMAVTDQGALWVMPVPSPTIVKGNPLALPCNPVRRTNCR